MDAQGRPRIASCPDTQEPSSAPLPASPAPADSQDGNAKAAPDRHAHSVEDAEADGSDRATETETPRGSGV